ncbi:MAG: bifunctional (p)ppGpp synthetase/guanosine-3',5'-bis(diphosphate) 3'-pyrophosphohydrolase [Clostridiales bacterium]|nr:bifunctional (p)ppGpp synthetase/guanosine-3',5'-bis(diphosphate) 3'-pyrophosphohydrolase [Clostridiales bacterium]
MTLVSDAMLFAARAHDGMLRKGTGIPYILHPGEVAAIAATLTDDQEILAAALLHDVMEDCGVGEKELAERFGSRVAQLVRSETQERGGDPGETWLSRKQGAVMRIAQGDRAVKIIALSDKLSNMRAIHRDYDRHGERLFFRFHQHDKALHAWYYRSIAALLEGELGNTDAWCELSEHIAYVFADVPSGMQPSDEA